MKHRIVTPAQIEQAKAMRMQRWPWMRIAAALGLPRTTIKYWAADREASRERMRMIQNYTAKRGRDWTEREFEMAKHMKRSGMTYQEIAAELGRLPESIRTKFRRESEVRTQHPKVHQAEFIPPPPQYVLDERDRAYSADKTIATELMGDPLPGRSALERMRG